MDALREFTEGRVPNEWVRVTDAEVAFEREGFRVEAKRRTTPRRFGRAWEIRCREFAGEAEGLRTMRYVTSRAEAVAAVYDCMNRFEAGESLGETRVPDEYASQAMRAPESEAASPRVE
ncbi:hypothetical protein [Haloprofundus halobius]|uniref:hypothetical protein n=1 Tax=Haloprofundus halobius TaxID=2876194 RepID=UPI001CC9C5E1|nr:hypothetical protein [Haloprofundus halobius]